MATFVKVKSPGATLDYIFDWKPLTNGNGASDYLEDGETISAHTITADDGITVDSSNATYTNTGVKVWLSDGADGEAYNVVCEVVTSGGRTDQRTLRVLCRNL